MIFLFTDFGLEGPYVGQMKAVLHQEAPAVPVIDLIADVPPFQAQAAAYLLAAYTADLAVGSVCLCVVDPGVGGSRQALVVEADGRWYVGPDNGLFAIVGRRAVAAKTWEVTWRPEHLSATFHGRDLFAPVAARLARGEAPPGDLKDNGLAQGQDWPDDLAKIVYIDRFGNGISGLRAKTLPPVTNLSVGGRPLEHARTFSDRPLGAAFWYENSNGLVELAVNQGRADQVFGLVVGQDISVTGRAPG
jgi:S-adenosylmethionine hydrolase